MKRVLVTGATGFLGRQTLLPLEEAGYEVHAADIRGLPIPSVHFHPVDLMDRDGLNNIVHKVRPTHLLHLAWYVKHGEFWNSVENARWVQASINLLLAFAEAGGTRVVSAGTCAEYEWGHDRCIEDITPCRPSTLYGSCKLGLSLIQTGLCRQLQISGAWGRIFHLYGPFEPEKRFVAFIIRSLLAGQPAPCTMGTQVRDFMHVSDVARAFAAVLDSAVEGPINIASGQPILQREIADEIATQLEGRELLQPGAVPMGSEPERLVADISRLAFTGFQPRLSLREGIADSVAWWRDRVPSP
jgi:nucleoside-diphosphate-sugar epimerase